MRSLHAVAAAVVLVTSAQLAVSALPQNAAPALQERDFLTRIRRLTVEGRRAGEGYWSPDGKRLVFQSERDSSNPWYQIFTLDLTSGDVKRISPGVGKTTCAFFRPNSDQILFSSTHLDPKSKQFQDEELAFRASGKERRYSWDYDHALNEKEKKALEENPSIFAEIYIMKPDGSGQTRLTTSWGYDGGPFFTHDGQRIVWRRFDEMGLIADIWTMKLDGTDQK